MAALADRTDSGIGIMDSAVQLTDLSPSTHLDAPGPEEQSHQANGFSLPPVDRGKHAWLFLLGAFCVEAVVWGLPFSYGLFEEYYGEHEPFSSQQASLAIIGTSATGVMYMSPAVLMPLFNRRPGFRRPATIVGLIIMAISLELASFANEVWHLTLTQGFIYGLGGSLLYFPALLFLDEWFVKRKGFAYGVMWAGTGVSGVVVPLIMNSGLEAFGFRTMLRAWGLGVLIVTVPILYYIKPRLPAAASGQQRRMDLSFITSPVFLCLQLCNIVQGLGHFIPSIYLPTISQSLGASSANSALTIVLLNLAVVVGSTTLGALTDRLHVTTCLFIASGGASLAVFLLWGFSQSIAVLLVFSLCYGFTAGAYSTTYAGILQEIQKSYAADTGLTIGLLAMGRGIGAIASGPLSESLLSKSSAIGSSASLYGSQYGILVLFTGATAVVGGSGVVFYRLGLW